MYFSIFASFTPAFSPSLASARGAPVSAFCGSSVVRSHFATTSHWPLASLTMPARCLLRVRLVASSVFVVALCACPTHPVRAQARPLSRTAPLNLKLSVIVRARHKDRFQFNRLNIFLAITAVDRWTIFGFGFCVFRQNLISLVVGIKIAKVEFGIGEVRAKRHTQNSSDSLYRKGRIFYFAEHN